MADKPSTGWNTPKEAFNAKKRASAQANRKTPEDIAAMTEEERKEWEEKELVRKEKNREYQRKHRAKINQKKESRRRTTAPPAEPRRKQQESRQPNGKENVRPTTTPSHGSELTHQASTPIGRYPHNVPPPVYYAEAQPPSEGSMYPPFGSNWGQNNHHNSNDWDAPHDAPSTGNGIPLYGYGFGYYHEPTTIWQEGVGREHSMEAEHPWNWGQPPPIGHCVYPMTIGQMDSRPPYHHQQPYNNFGYGGMTAASPQPTVPANPTTGTPAMMAASEMDAFAQAVADKVAEKLASLQQEKNNADFPSNANQFVECDGKEYEGQPNVTCKVMQTNDFRNVVLPGGTVHSTVHHHHHHYTGLPIDQDSAERATASPATDGASVSADFSRMTVKELKAELNRRGLPRTGVKADLLSRLQSSVYEA